MQDYFDKAFVLVGLAILSQLVDRVTKLIATLRKRSPNTHDLTPQPK